MNYIDIVISLILVFAIFDGLRKGIVVQLCSIAAILLGVWLASRYATVVGAWLHISESWATVGGFLIIFISIIIAVACLSPLLRGVFKFVGLGLIDRLLGGLLSVAKFALILSLLFGAFDTLNKQFNIVEQHRLEASILYTPIERLRTKIFPALDWTQKQISSGLENI